MQGVLVARLDEPGVSRGVRFYHDEQLVHDRVRAYYEALNEHAPFRAALRRLYVEARGLLPRHWEFVDSPPWEPLAVFVADWHLPRRRCGPRKRDQQGRADVWETLVLAHHSVGDEWRLRPDRRTAELFVPDVRLESLTVRWQSPVVRGTVRPFVPRPFVYDPIAASDSPARLRRRAAAAAAHVKKSIEDQARKIEEDARAAGYRPTPPQHNPGELRRNARRLFRAAVLGLGNEKIRALEYSEHVGVGTYRPCSPQAVSKSVIEWAKVLDVPLPPR